MIHTIWTILCHIIYMSMLYVVLSNTAPLWLYWQIYHCNAPLNIVTDKNAINHLLVLCYGHWEQMTMLHALTLFLLACKWCTDGQTYVRGASSISVPHWISPFGPKVLASEQGKKVLNAPKFKILIIDQSKPPSTFWHNGLVIN